MSGAVLAVALTLVAGARTERLVQSVEQLAHVEALQDGFVRRWIGRVLGGLAGQVIDFQVKRDPPTDATVAPAAKRSAAPEAEEESDSVKVEDADDNDSDDNDADDDDNTPVQVNFQIDGKDGKSSSFVISTGPRVPKASIAPVPPVPPVPPIPPLPPRAHFDGTEDLHGANDGSGTQLISEHVKQVPSVELLHNIANVAGWSLTLVGVGRDKIDVDFDSLEPTEALRTVLLKANCMGVLRGDKLAVMAATSGHSAGLLVEQRSNGTSQARNRSGNRSGDLVKVGGDVIVAAGTVVQGDAVAVLGSVEVEQGAVVQGSAAAIGGSVTVHPGGVVLGDSVALGGANDVERGGQVLGDHVQVGIGPLFSSSEPRHKSFLSRVGPFGLFPTLALFAVVYLVGLLALRLWPERMRAMGSMVVENPLRSFVIGVLSWLLFAPLFVLLIVSVVGILLVPLLPLLIALSVMLGACALALRIGEALPAGEGHKFVPPAALAMGLTAMLFISLVPWVGVPSLVLVLFVAPGAVISSRFGRTLPNA